MLFWTFENKIGGDIGGLLYWTSYCLKREMVTRRMDKKFIFKDNAFDFIRYWAAITVMLGHFVWKAASYTQGNTIFHVIGRVSNFFPGVVILFAMSGFLISASFERSKDKKVMSWK